MRRERRYWLVKSEPNSFSWEDFWALPKRITHWDGVRNYQARNMLRDEMKKGDLVFFYHSSTEPAAILGIAEVVREGYPDPTAFDPRDDHFDPKSNQDNPVWFVVDLKASKPFPRAIALAELRQTPGLEKMTLLQKGSRLSVQPVSLGEWEIICELAKKG